MSPGTGDFLKPNLSRKTLEAHNIFFCEHVCNSEELEDWIQPIREQLIRLRKKLPIKAKSQFAKELKAFRSSGQDSKEAFRDEWSLKPLENEAESVYVEGKGFRKDRSIGKIKNEIGACEEIKGDAIYLCGRDEKEPSWMKYLQAHFFKKFHEVHGPSNSYE